VSHKIHLEDGMKEGSRFYWVYGALLGCLIAFDMLMSHVVHLQIHQFIDIPSVVILSACVYYRSHFPRVIATAEIAMIAVVTMPTLALLPQVVARFPRPLVDSQLASIDSAVHFNTAHFVHLFERSSALQHHLSWFTGRCCSISPLPPCCSHLCWDMPTIPGVSCSRS
jgi:hypothetical protein